MTTSIEVSFGANSGDVSQAQIPVEVIDAKMGTAWRGTTTLSGPTTVTVSAPGVYLVRATLPSGELMSSTIRVAKDQTTKATLRPPKQSPNEGLAWAYYMQRLPARSGWREHVSVVDDAAVAGDLAFAPAVPPSCDFWLQGRENVWRPARPTDLTIQAVSINPGDPTALMATEVSIVNSVASVWAAIEWQNARQLVAVPVWNLQRIRVLIVRNDADDHDVAPFRALVGGSHPQVEAILGFLTSGDFEAARQIGQLWFDQAEQMLRNKVIDPIAATVAGYFLLRAGAFDRMGDWTTNLATWFPSIPDGAVICGWHMALTNRWDLAEHWLTEAVQRGVPLYTQGLRLLYDGLRVLVARSARVGDSFDRVQAIAARAKWTSGVTSLMATDPLELQKQSTAAVAGRR